MISLCFWFRRRVRRSWEGAHHRIGRRVPLRAGETPFKKTEKCRPEALPSTAKAQVHLDSLRRTRGDPPLQTPPSDPPLQTPPSGPPFGPPLQTPPSDPPFRPPLQTPPSDPPFRPPLQTPPSDPPFRPPLQTPPSDPPFRPPLPPPSNTALPQPLCGCGPTIRITRDV